MRTVPVIAMTRRIVAVDGGVEVENFAMAFAKDPHGGVRCRRF